MSSQIPRSASPERGVIPRSGDRRSGPGVASFAWPGSRNDAARASTPGGRATSRRRCGRGRRSRRSRVWRSTRWRLRMRRGQYTSGPRLPGRVPVHAGVYPSMYRGKLWTMRQFAGFGTAEETNARFKYLLEHGQTGFRRAFDMPTLMGLRPRLTRCRWARSAVRASRSTSLADMEIAVRRHPARRGHDLDDDQLAGGDRSSRCTSRRRRSRACRASGCAGRSRTTS